MSIIHFWDKYPNTDYYRVQLDYILGKIKDVDLAATELPPLVIKAQESQESAQESAQAAQNSAQEAQNSAQEAQYNAQEAQERAQDAQESAIATSQALAPVTQELNLLAARVDNIIVNGTPTEGNTELIDIRVGGNGTTYPTAGDSVRGQYNELNNAIQTKVMRYVSEQSSSSVVTDLNGFVLPGWYRIKISNTTTNTPPMTITNDINCMLVVFSPSTTTQHNIQLLFSPSSPPEIWWRYVGNNGLSSSVWGKVTENTEYQSAINNLLTITSNLNIKASSYYFTGINQDDLSLNANYFNAETAEWTNGLVNTRTGTITESSNYEYSYCHIKGQGTYIIATNTSDYGTNAARMALFDINKQFLRYKNAESSENNIHKYILESSDCVDAIYTVLQRKKVSTTIPKLFFNSINTELNTFPIAHDLPFSPKYGFITDPLYKAIVVCDGDSICRAALDNPYQWNGYYGRIKRNYQTSGYNYAVGGGTIMDRRDETLGNSPRHSVCMNIDTIHAEYPQLDYLILEGGVNDADLTGHFSNDTPPARFGTWFPNDFSGNYDPSTFCGGVEYLFYRAVTYYPNTKIGFIIPMEMGTNNNTINNRKRYFDEIVTIAKKWGIPVLNLWENCHADARLNAYFNSSLDSSGNVDTGKFYNDGQHPTSYGYNLIQTMIETWIKTL